VYAKKKIEKEIEPFWASLYFEKGILHPYTHKVERRLSDMVGIFNDYATVESMLDRGENPLIYEVYEITIQPLAEGHLSFATTTLHPGKIGKEYYMTKGHFHAGAESAELYVGFRGEGIILLLTRGGKIMNLSFKAGRAIYVPPNWAHRTVNTSKKDLVFMTAHPSSAVHDYRTIEKKGFPKIVVEQKGRPVLIENPRYRRR